MTIKMKTLLQEKSSMLKEERDLFGEFDQACELVKDSLDLMRGKYLSQTQFDKANRMLHSMNEYIMNV